ncbi:MAG: hypothetical protein ONB05_07525 [candidate division KSB1 bacterium]|nr:hypothetical protein [candidate division KSB1 bacterium]
MEELKKCRSLSLACCLLFFWYLTAYSQIPSTPNEESQSPRNEQKESRKPLPLSRVLSQASEPSRLFVAPTSRVLGSLEFHFSGGSSFGVEENSSFLGKVSLGLGGIAEVEFSTSKVINKLTGEATTLPTSIFKVLLVPQRFSQLWYIPQVALQLRSSSWRSLANEGTRPTAEASADYMGRNLASLSLSSRFTTLYLVVGKDGALGGLYGGCSLTDVRTQRGWQWIYDRNTYTSLWMEIPELQKNILAPWGGLIIVANPSTRLMAEVEAIPMFDYNVPIRTVRIRHAWLGIAGVRFFMGKWLSLDTGVKYQSDYKGIADTEINLGLNVVLPVARIGG